MLFHQGHPLALNEGGRIMIFLVHFGPALIMRHWKLWILARVAFCEFAIQKNACSDSRTWEGNAQEPTGHFSHFFPTMDITISR